MLTEIIIIKFIILYFFNLLLDYPLQGSYLAESKADNNYLLFVHCAIWSFGLSIVLIPLGLFSWGKVLMLLVGHFLIDYWKSHKIYNSFISDNVALYIDQFLHVVQLILCLL